MSDNWLQFVPTDPRFLPSDEAADNARRLLASFVPESASVTATFKGQVKFFHPLGNWSGVECPSCGADAEPWWEEAMCNAANTQFLELLVTTPCCGFRVSLNELRYLWPAAFGSFVLEAKNPNVRDLSPEQELALSKTLRSPLRRIWVHL